MIGEIVIRMLEPPVSNFEFIVSRPKTIRLYELLPSSSDNLLGHRILVNSFGIRDRYFSKDKPTSVFRIIVLGDSITMGPGVDSDQTYPKQLEFLLNSQSQGHKFEVMNFGVWGYNTVQEVDFFEAKGLDFSPDLVLLGFFPNDAARTHSLEKQYRTFLHKFMDVSHFIRFLKPRFAALGRRLNLPLKTYVTSLIDDYRNNSPTWNECQVALRRLKYLSNQYNFRLVVVMIPLPVELNSRYPLSQIHQKLALFCQKESTTFWDALPAFKNINASSLRVSITDGHFNTKAHRILSKFIYEKLLISEFLKF